MRRVIARYFKKCLYRAKNKYCSVILCVVKNIPLKKRAVHMPRALSVGYFANAQYDVLFYLSLRQCRVSKLACKGL